MILSYFPNSGLRKNNAHIMIVAHNTPPNTAIETDIKESHTTNVIQERESSSGMKTNATQYCFDGLNFSVDMQITFISKNIQKFLSEIIHKPCARCKCHFSEVRAFIDFIEIHSHHREAFT